MRMKTACLALVASLSIMTGPAFAVVKALDANKKVLAKARIKLGRY